MLPFDLSCTQAYASLMAKTRAAGVELGMAQGYVAAVAAANGLTVATRNAAPFQAAGVATLNPWWL